MNTVSNGIDQVRAQAQELHRTVLGATSGDRASIQADFGRLASDAQQLAASLQATAQSAQPAARAYLNDAASVMQDAANHARDAASASTPEIENAKAGLIAQISNGVKSVSQAVAAERSARKPVQG